MPCLFESCAHDLSDIMRRSFATITPVAPLSDAAHLLIEINQRGLPVIYREGALVGVISEAISCTGPELDISPPPGNWLEELLDIEDDRGQSLPGTQCVLPALAKPWRRSRDS